MIWISWRFFWLSASKSNIILVSFKGGTWTRQKERKPSRRNYSLSCAKGGAPQSEKEDWQWVHVYDSSILYGAPQQTLAKRTTNENCGALAVYFYGIILNYTWWWRMMDLIRPAGLQVQTLRSILPCSSPIRRFLKSCFWILSIGLYRKEHHIFPLLRLAFLLQTMCKADLVRLGWHLWSFCIPGRQCLGDPLPPGDCKGRRWDVCISHRTCLWASMWQRLNMKAGHWWSLRWKVIDLYDRKNIESMWYIELYIPVGCFTVSPYLRSTKRLLKAGAGNRSWSRSQECFGDLWGGIERRGFLFWT